MQLADGLAGLLAPAAAKLARKELGDLGVRIIRLATLPDQMLFDKERIAVKAGKPIEIQFENNDLMPHNFVLAQPGTLEEIGMMAESSATQPGALERHYVPGSAKILFSSRLLPPRGAQRLAFKAPAKPGVYPYICTYPGHWRRMFGALYVVADLEDYNADPEGYLAAHPLPIADLLLKFNRPRKEWKFEDLADSVAHLENGRSFGNAKQLFQVGACVACHKLNGVGNEIGPDLTKIDPKQQKPIEIWRDMVEPSFRINEKYQTAIIDTQAGKQIIGLIVEETPDHVKLLENPLAKTEPVLIMKSDIAERKKSPTSIMPKGLL
ncbi:MAG: plastocyanin/azurin family copper-binding protein, partial [Candidatus Acidiferrum sp.]